MKNYKLLVPVVLVVLFFASIFKLVSDKTDTQHEYDTALAQARDLRETEINVDAEKEYLKALGIRESEELYLEISDFYLNCDRKKDAINNTNKLLEKYPQYVQGYEFLLNIYLENQDYIMCWKLFEQADKRKAYSEQIQKVKESIMYEFFFNGDYADVGNYLNGYCPVKVGDLWGFANEVGNRTVSTQYKKVSAFSADNIAAVVTQDNQAYFIDTQGNKKRIVRNVDNVKELGLIQNEITPLYDGKVWGFYNLNGDKLFGDFQYATSLANGVAACEKDDRWNLYNSNGEKITEDTFESVLINENNIVLMNDRIFVQQNGTYNMIDSTGNRISENSYKDACMFNDNTYAAVKQNDLWGFIDKDGNFVVEPKYEKARSFSNGYAAVKENGKWGFIDTNGNMVIEPQFSDAKDFNSHGSAFVYDDISWKLLRLYKDNH